MKKTNLIFTLALTCLAVLFFTACNKKGCNDPDAVNFDAKADEDDGSCEYEHNHGEHAAISFVFNHQIDGEALVYDTFIYTNAAGNLYKVENMKYFVSDFILLSAEGNVMLEAEHYIDADDEATLTYVVMDEIPVREYSGILFTFGIDSLENTPGKFVNAPEVNMAWPEQLGGGYHYMKLEGKYDSAGTTKNYNVHLGPSNGGAGAGVKGNDYSVPVVLANSSFMAGDHDNVEVHINVNINEWFENPNTYDFNDYGEIIMPNQSAQVVLQENGNTVFTIEEIND